MSALAVGAASAQRQLDVDWRDSSSVRFSFTVAEGQGAGSDYAVRAVPVLAGALGDTLRLEPTVFRGKRNMRYIERARYYGTAGPAVGDELSAGQAKEYSVELSRGDYPWLWADKVSLAVERTKEGCCDVIPMQPVPVGSLMYVPAFAPVLAAVSDNTDVRGIDVDRLVSKLRTAGLFDVKKLKK